MEECLGLSGRRLKERRLESTKYESLGNEYNEIMIEPP